MERESKKTISIEHIDKALRELGFPEYVKEVVASAGDAREQLKMRERRGVGKWDSAGLSEEELMRQQAELFASAGGGGVGGGAGG